MSRICAYALCDAQIPGDAPGQRRFCKESHRVGAYRRRRAAELKRLRALVGAQATATS